MRRMRIGTTATFIAIAAFDLALMRELHTFFFLGFFIPLVAVAFVSLNLVLVQFFVLRKPLGVYHLGFIGAGLLYGLVTLRPRTRILETIIAWYRSLTGDTTFWWLNASNRTMYAELGLTVILGLVFCLAGGTLAAYVRARLRSRLRVESVTTRL